MVFNDLWGEATCSRESPTLTMAESHGNFTWDNGKLDITGIESQDYMSLLGGPRRRRREEDRLVSHILFVKKLALYFHWIKKRFKNLSCRFNLCLRRACGLSLSVDPVTESMHVTSRLLNSQSPEKSAFVSKY